MRIRLSLILILVPFSARTVAEDKAETIKFLTGLQQADGGFLPAPGAKGGSSLRATSAAVRAIKYLGGEVPNRAKARDFVLSCYHADTGAFSDQPGGAGDVTHTAVGLMAVAELDPKFLVGESITYLGKTAKTFEERRLAVAGMEAVRAMHPAISKWFEEVKQGRNPDGTYGSGDGLARETGGIAAMILRVGYEISPDHRKAIVAALKGAQRSDGGFGKADTKSSDMETTYRVMRAFHLLKEEPADVAKLKEFLAKHRNADGGYGATPGQPSTVSGTYYVAIVEYWLSK